MALTIHEVYQATKSLYQMTLLTGEKGLGHIMNWVYVSEDIGNADFLHGGELIITTGVTNSSSDWLYHFIESIISRNTCGLIINVGKYIQTADLTEDILQLCEANDFPLFTIPWDIHLYDITRDYYNRIFLDTQSDQSILRAFLGLLRQDNHQSNYITTLDEHNFSVTGEYCICILNSSLHPDSSGMDSPDDTVLLFMIQTFIKSRHLPCHITNYKESLLFIFYQTQMSVILESMDELLAQLQVKSNSSLHMGIGDMIHTLYDLYKSYRQGNAALSLALHENRSICNYNDLGFFRLLLEINDLSLLETYVDETLGNITAYDEAHSSNYEKTLEEYLRCNGSVQTIASTLFCHRNTINYRIRMIKETFQLDLDSADVCFKLRSAFQIKSYLQILML